MFEYGCMLQTAALASRDALQRRIAEMQPPPTGRVLPTAPGLAPLLPGGALRPGASYAVRGSWQLALAFLAEASTAGSWCGVIGCDAFGAEAAASLGVALDRCMLVPEPGPHALGVAGALAEVLDIVVLAGSGVAAGMRPGDSERIAAKLRDHGSALVVVGDWPRVETALTVTGTRWRGLGEGHGLIEACDLTVQSRDRRGERLHTVRFSRGRLVDPGEAPVYRLPHRPVHGRTHGAVHRS